jgi:DNA-binding NtrC family response regulator
MTETHKILVVDDDPDIQESCRIVLESAGYQVASALSAEEAQAAMRSSVPDLIVLDIMMETADAGFLFAGWLGQHHPGLPVIMVSGVADAAEQLFDTSTLPVSELVNKPIAPAALLSTVARLIQRAEASRK